MTTGKERKDTNIDPSQAFREGGSISAIERVRRHPFNFGLETAIAQSGSKIRPVNGIYMLSFEPAKVNDIWHGDCTIDAMLTEAALKEFLQPDQIRTESVLYEIPSLNFRGGHIRVLVDVEDQAIPVEHSAFFSQLPA